MSRVLLVSLFAVVCAGCDRVPSELRPGFTSIIGLPFNFCTDLGSGPATLLIRNVGDNDVTIDRAEFRGASVSAFDAPELDKTVLLSEEEGFVQFTYRVPGGVKQEASLVIVSDAEVNPELVVPVETQEIPAGVNKEEVCGA